MRYLVRKIAIFILLTTPAAFLAGCGTHPAEAHRDGGTTGRATQPVEEAAAPAAAPAGESKGDAPHAKLNEVVIDNFAFSPRTLTVAAGTKVTWTNRDDVPHTATSTRKPRLFDSGTLDTDDTYSHVFVTPGTYDYFCAVHPHMTGRIVVK
jgi:plastocyanin